MHIAAGAVISMQKLALKQLRSTSKSCEGVETTERVGLWSVGGSSALAAGVRADPLTSLPFGQFHLSAGDANLLRSWYCLLA
jgi:hypothetical protein